MTEQKFRSEMRRAETMRSLADPMMAEYWAGYIRGLRRAHHGEKFGTEEEHALWLSLTDRRDERSKQRGRGYREGLSFAEVSGRVGRPSVGDTTLDKITVPTELKTALEHTAEERGITVAEARREAYRQWIQKE